MSAGSDAQAPDGRDPTCSPCRGTGRVISNLGGERREVTCPWCGGSGRFDPERDARSEAPGA